MMTTFIKNAHTEGSTRARFALVCSLLVMLAGCGKDSDDGDVTNTVQLPVDNVLNLYCADIGIFPETCVLDDPNNPYARTPFVTPDPSDDNEPPGVEFNNAKFALANAAPSPKARFYVFATALAIAPTGENQWYTARALHELFTASGSELIKNQAIRAYRSNLDNFFDQATFFVANFLPAPPPGGIAYPNKIRELTAMDLALTPTGYTPLFFPTDAGNNEFFARQTLGGWGYTWVGMLDGPGGPASVPGPVTKN